MPTQNTKQQPQLQSVSGLHSDITPMVPKSPFAPVGTSFSSPSTSVVLQTSQAFERAFNKFGGGGTTRPHPVPPSYGYTGAATPRSPAILSSNPSLASQQQLSPGIEFQTSAFMPSALQTQNTELLDNLMDGEEEEDETDEASVHENLSFKGMPTESPSELFSSPLQFLSVMEPSKHAIASMNSTDFGSTTTGNNNSHQREGSYSSVSDALIRGDRARKPTQVQLRQNSTSRISGAGMSFGDISQSLAHTASLHSMNSIVGNSNRQKEVRERRAHLNQSLAHVREKTLEDSRARLMEADERRSLLSAQGAIQRHWAWATLLCLSKYQVVLVRASKDLDRRKRLRENLMPRLQLRARRWLRRARLHIACKNGLPSPQVAQLRMDRTLNLFSDSHLSHLSSNFEPRYYFQGETIIFMGAEDDECFVLHSGSADVIVGSITVSHLEKRGSVFGSVGMISGEPRTATIIAREPCVVWVCNRAKFEAGGMGDAGVQQALAVISDLRTHNLRAVYKRYITPLFLSTFSTLRDVPSTSLEHILNKAGPLIAKPGIRLVTPYAMNAFDKTTTHRWYLLLRGSIRIAYTHPVGGVSATNVKSCLRELVQRLVQFSQRGARVTFADDCARKAEPQVIHPALVHLDAMNMASLTEGTTIAVIKGPLLLNVAQLVMTDVAPLPFIVETFTACDLLFMTRNSLMELDLIDVDNVRQGCHQLHTEFIKPLTAKALRLASCRGVLGVAQNPFLKVLDQQQGKQPQQQSATNPSTTVTTSSVPHQRPQSIGNCETLYFDPNHGMEAYIILNGEVEGVPTGTPTPYLWPDLTLVYYGSMNAKAVAQTAVDALRVHRKDIVDWFVSSLSSKEMELFVGVMMRSFELTYHHKPHFSFEGLSSASNNGDREVLRKKRSVFALHRTANFNVNEQEIQDSRISQRRSLAAALAYQVATDEGVEEAPPKTNTRRLKSKAVLKSSASKLLSNSNSNEDLVEAAPTALEESTRSGGGDVLTSQSLLSASLRKPDQTSGNGDALKFNDCAYVEMQSSDDDSTTLPKHRGQYFRGVYSQDSTQHHSPPTSFGRSPESETQLQSGISTLSLGDLRIFRKLPKVGTGEEGQGGDDTTGPEEDLGSDACAFGDHSMLTPQPPPGYGTESPFVRSNPQPSNCSLSNTPQHQHPGATSTSLTSPPNLPSNRGNATPEGSWSAMRSALEFELVPVEPTFGTRDAFGQSISVRRPSGASLSVGVSMLASNGKSPHAASLPVGSGLSVPRQHHHIVTRRRSEAQTESALNNAKARTNNGSAEAVSPAKPTSSKTTKRNAPLYTPSPKQQAQSTNPAMTVSKGGGSSTTPRMPSSGRPVSSSQSHQAPHAVVSSSVDGSLTAGKSPKLGPQPFREVSQAPSGNLDALLMSIRTSTAGSHHQQSSAHHESDQRNAKSGTTTTTTMKPPQEVTRYLPAQLPRPQSSNPNDRLGMSSRNNPHQQPGGVVGKQTHVKAWLSQIPQ